MRRKKTNDWLSFPLAVREHVWSRKATAIPSFPDDPFGPFASQTFRPEKGPFDPSDWEEDRWSTTSLRGLSVVPSKIGGLGGILMMD